ncbi:MAG: cyclic nucleotide-binding domain-containing protein, partial [bacterium]
MDSKGFLLIMEDIIFLKKTSIFSGVSTEDLKAIAAIGQENSCEKNTLIVREGDSGDSLFLIKSGSVRVTKGSGQNEVSLALLPAGSFFGDMVLFEDAPRSANCYADTDCKLLKLQRDDLIEVIMQHPRIAIELFKIMGNRLREANKRF